MTQEEMLTQIMTAVSTLQNSVSTIQDEISTMNKRFDRVEVDLSGVKTDLSGVKEDTQRTREIVTRMEIEHGKKLDVLFDADTRDHEKIVEDILPRLDEHDQKIGKLEQHIVSLKRA